MLCFFLSLYIFLIPMAPYGIPTISIGGIGLSIIQLFEIVLLFFALIKIARARYIYIDPAIKLLLLILMAWGLESMVHLWWLDSYYYGYDLKRPLNFAEYIAIILIFLIIVNDHEKVRKILFVYLTSAFIVMLLTYGKSLGWNLTGFERNTTYLIGPFTYGVAALFQSAEGYAAWTLPLISVSIVSIFGKYPLKLNTSALLAVCLLTLFGVSLNGSRGTLLACAGSLMVTLFFTNHFRVMKNNPFKIYTKPALFIFFGAGSLSILYYSGEIYNALMQIRTETILQRLAGYSLALNLANENAYFFLFGAGKDLFVNEMSRIYGTRVVAHNSIIEELVADGLFGVLFFALFFSMAIMISLKNISLLSNLNDGRNHTISVILLAQLVSLSFLGISSNITPTYSLWIIISLTVCGYNSCRRFTNQAATKPADFFPFRTVSI